MQFFFLSGNSKTICDFLQFTLSIVMVTSHRVFQENFPVEIFIFSFSLCDGILRIFPSFPPGTKSPTTLKIVVYNR